MGYGEFCACNILVRMQKRDDDDGEASMAPNVAVSFVDFDESEPPETTVYHSYRNADTVNRPPHVKEVDSLQFRSRYLHVRSNSQYVFSACCIRVGRPGDD